MKLKISSHLPFLINQKIHTLKNKRKYKYIREYNSGHLFNEFDQHKCLFVHIPKTGGVSVYRSLFSSRENGSFIKSIGHFTIQDYQIIFGKILIKEYFKFALVRNPWSRVLSSYHFLKHGGFHERDKEWADKNLSTFKSFDEFIFEWINSKNIYKALHFIPQYKFLTTRDEENAMDFIGKLENIETDFNLIKDKLGINCQLRHHNKNKSTKEIGSYRKFYTKDTQEIVARVYRKDIELFDYTF